VTAKPVTLPVVCAALVDQAGRVLLAQRPKGKEMAGLWEFPGGKIAPGETPEAALARELAEELGIAIDGGALTPLAFASHAYATFHVVLLLYLCRNWRGEPAAREGQALAWVAPRELLSYAMPPADAPLVAALRRALETSGTSLTSSSPST
jgi:8-oxo-dGTP diphosphatase